MLKSSEQGLPLCVYIAPRTEREGEERRYSATKQVKQLNHLNRGLRPQTSSTDVSNFPLTPKFLHQPLPKPHATDAAGNLSAAPGGQ